LTGHIKEIRHGLLNEDVIDLYSRVNVGTKIVVLPNDIFVATIAAPASAPRPPHTSNIY
jgi:hypothetical protein